MARGIRIVGPRLPRHLDDEWVQQLGRLLVVPRFVGVAPRLGRGGARQRAERTGKHETEQRHTAECACIVPRTSARTMNAFSDAHGGSTLLFNHSFVSASAIASVLSF
jgi:hypothetical protein